MAMMMMTMTMTMTMMTYGGHMCTVTPNYHRRRRVCSLYRRGGAHRRCSTPFHTLPQAQRRASTMFQRVAAAWETLGDEARRAKYDHQHELDKLSEWHHAGGRPSFGRRRSAHVAAPNSYHTDAAYYAAKMDAAYYSSFSPQPDENRPPPFKHRWSSVGDDTP